MIQQHQNTANTTNSNDESPLGDDEMDAGENVVTASPILSTWQKIRKVFDCCLFNKKAMIVWSIVAVLVWRSFSLPSVESLVTVKGRCSTGNLLNSRECNDSNEITRIGGRAMGTIPTEIGLLTSLSRLDLDIGKIKGTIPTEIGLLTSLQHLDLGFNGINGNLPSEIGQLTNLTYLGLDNNNLSGTVPIEVINLRTDFFTSVALGGNENLVCPMCNTTNHTEADVECLPDDICPSLLDNWL